mgnify:FL=1
MTDQAPPFATAPDRPWPYASRWKALLARGVIAMLLGIVAMLYPFSALIAFTMVFAIYAFIDGVFSVIAAIRRAGEGGHWIAMLLRGLLGVALGIVFVAMPLTATVSYALITLFFLAGWAILSGVLEIVAAIRLRDEIEGEWLLAVNGLLTLALGIGIIILFTLNPVVSILSLGWAIGAYALLSGLLLIVLAFRLRRKAQGRA